MFVKSASAKQFCHTQNLLALYALLGNGHYNITFFTSWYPSKFFLLNFVQKRQNLFGSFICKSDKYKSSNNISLQWMRWEWQVNPTPSWKMATFFWYLWYLLNTTSKLMTYTKQVKGKVSRGFWLFFVETVVLLPLVV